MSKKPKKVILSQTQINDIGEEVGNRVFNLVLKEFSDDYLKFTADFIMGELNADVDNYINDEIDNANISKSTEKKIKKIAEKELADELKSYNEEQEKKKKKKKKGEKQTSNKPIDPRLKGEALKSLDRNILKGLTDKTVD